MPKNLTKESAKSSISRGSNIPTELAQQRYAEFVALKKDEEGALADYKTAQSYTRKHLKACKADGINPALFVKLYNESKIDPAQIALERAEEDRLREMLNMQISTGDLFPDTLNGAVPGRTNDVLDRHYSEGLSAAARGEANDSHDLPIGSPEEIAWTKGFNAKLKEGLGGPAAPKSLAEAGAAELADAQAANGGKGTKAGNGNGNGKGKSKAGGGSSKKSAASAEAAVH